MNRKASNVMDKPGSMINGFAMLIGIFLLIEGIWGLFRQVTFGVLATNNLHAVIHIILGITGIGLSMKHNARGYCRFLGFLLLGVGLLRLIPGIDDLIVRVLNMNFPVAVLNLIVGAVSLYLSYQYGRSYRVA